MSYFVCYEKLKEIAYNNIQGGDDLSLGLFLLCSSLSSALAASVSNAVDVVKTRVQLSGKKSILVIKEMLYKDGLMSFTKGVGARILWVTPSVSISMTAYELLKIHGITS